jgi:hypothetical protein
VAVTTLTIYTGWMHFLIGLFLASFFSRWVLFHEEGGLLAGSKAARQHCWHLGVSA